MRRKENEKEKDKEGEGRRRKENEKEEEEGKDDVVEDDDSTTPHISSDKKECDVYQISHLLFLQLGLYTLYNNDNSTFRDIIIKLRNILVKKDKLEKSKIDKIFGNTLLIAKKKGDKTKKIVSVLQNYLDKCEELK